jgi:hypothetical protein
MKNFFAKIYYTILMIRNYLFTLIAIDINYQSIPIIINNRNRLTFLKILIESLKKRGYKNITILDNASTYKPLLNYYEETDCKVIFLEANLGYNALEKIPLYKVVRKNYFVYTDSDLLPIDECPENFLLFFKQALERNPQYQKVGFSLKIDDLPDHFNDREAVINWESKFYEKSFDEGLFIAPVDTTFALHRPYATLSTKGRFKMFRAKFPYVAHHLPWYNDSSQLTEEETYYIEHVEIGTQWSKGIKVLNRSFIHRLLGNS